MVSLYVNVQIGGFQRNNREEEGKENACDYVNGRAEMKSYDSCYVELK